ncbi:hypothetical protein ZIOFF_060803 [Zingiber officinale]|uniref:Uncharacterized protein n=1 Tax=Zingiber officinale TaxID=94328 RepID=A0A8J5FH42_ZINOF|nr:hypothetical protein ZIOFF_060803 [Zingiber officinale]
MHVLSGLAVISLHNFSLAGEHIASKWKRYSSLVTVSSGQNKWIYHHYCAMLMAIISLTWEIKRQPDCAYKQRGVQLFLVWAMMQGVSMLLQNRYQRQRLYTRIALGKVTDSNVAPIS